MIGSKKYMVLIFWNPHYFYLVKLLPYGMKFNSNYFINEILEPINEMITPLREEIDQNIILHFDNARPHNSNKVIQYLESHGMDRAPQPLFSPEIAPSDFYLFGYIKKMLQGHSYDTPDDLLSAITEILNNISPDALVKVFLNWHERLKQLIDKNGDYIE